MRRQIFAAAAVLLSLVAFAVGEEAKPLTPDEAAKKVNEKVTVEMEVKSATLRGDNCFLNSKEDFKDDKNFTVFINKDALQKFKDAKIDDPAAHFKGKTIRVTGTVKLYREKPEIILEGPDQVKVVDKKP